MPTESILSARDSIRNTETTQATLTGFNLRNCLNGFRTLEWQKGTRSLQNVAAVGIRPPGLINLRVWRRAQAGQSLVVIWQVLLSQSLEERALGSRTLRKGTPSVYASASEEVQWVWIWACGKTWPLRWRSKAEVMPIGSKQDGICSSFLIQPLILPRP